MASMNPSLYRQVEINSENLDTIQTMINDGTLGKQFIISDTEPIATAQHEGYFWFKPVYDTGGNLQAYELYEKTTSGYVKFNLVSCGITTQEGLTAPGNLSFGNLLIGSGGDAGTRVIKMWAGDEDNKPTAVITSDDNPLIYTVVGDTVSSFQADADTLDGMTKDMLLTEVDTKIGAAIVTETAARTAAISIEAEARNDADALLAPLANPVFTGTPTAPTAPDGTSTTQLATTAFVTTQLNSLKTSVSSGKILVANAITGKGVATSSSDTFATMASNIGNIPVSKLTLGYASLGKRPTRDTYYFFTIAGGFYTVLFTYTASSKTFTKTNIWYTSDNGWASAIACLTGSWPDTGGTFDLSIGGGPTNTYTYPLAIDSGDNVYVAGSIMDSIVASFVAPV